MKEIGLSVENVKAEEPEAFQTIKQDCVYSIPKFSLQQYNLTYAFNYASPNSCHETLHILRP